MDTSDCIQSVMDTHFPHCNLHRVDTRGALSDALQSQQWNLMFSEMELADFNADELPDIFERYKLSIPVALIADADVRHIATNCLEYVTSQLVHCDKQYLHHLPVTVEALLKKAEQQQQQHLYEQRLIESEERFLDVFNNTSDLIQCIAPDGSFLYTNNAWRRAMGYSREEVQALNLVDVLHPDSLDCCQQRFKLLMQGRELPEIDFKFVTRSGETLHLMGECGSIVKDGVATSTRGIFRNVTETVHAEQALKASEARYQALYDNAPDIYTTLDSKGRILSVNKTGLDMLGYSEEEVRGKPAIDIVHPEDQDRVASHAVDVFSNGCDDSGIEYRKIRKDGTEIWVHQRMNVVDYSGESQLMVICRDITVRRALQEKLAYHASHDSLTQLINRRELETRLERVLSDMSPHDSHILCFLDLDEFKAVNDMNGHAAGDELLKQVTLIFREYMRSRDTLARIGGDEFAILMEHCPIAAAISLIEKIITTISEFHFDWRAQTFTIGVSIGVSKLRAGHDVSEMLDIVDAACYKAKANGRGCYYIDEAE